MRNKYLIMAFLFCFVFTMSFSLYAQTSLFATVVKLGVGAWQGGVRVVPMLVKYGSYAKNIGVGLSPTTLAILAGAVFTTWAVVNIAKLPMFQSFLTSRNYGVNGGVYKAVVNTGGMLPETAGASGLTEINGLMEYAYSEGYGGWTVEVLQNLTALQAREAVLLSGGGYAGPYNAAMFSTVTGAVCVGVYTKQNCNPGPYCGVTALSYPVSPGDYTSTWGYGATIPASQIGTDYTNDITSPTPSPEAYKTWEEFEKAIKDSLAGKTSPFLSDILKSMNQAGQTLQQLLDAGMLQAAPNVVAALQALQNAVTSETNLDAQLTDPAAAAAEAETENKENADAWQGEGVPEPSTWEDPPSISDLWDDFLDAAGETGLFLLPSALSSGIPGGGASVIAFNGGVFGDQSFDFSDWASNVLLILRSVVMVIFSFVAIRVIVLKS